MKYMVQKTSQLDMHCSIYLKFTIQKYKMELAWLWKQIMGSIFFMGNI
jgi:hypothetical protein